MPAYLIVFLGAGLGGALRHGVNVAALRLLGSGFPYGTLTVNIVGSFVMGLLTGYFALKADPGQDVAPVFDDRHSRRLHDFFRVLARYGPAL
jgi:fluoride ion exporter CrcB/FEX